MQKTITGLSLLETLVCLGLIAFILYSPVKGKSWSNGKGVAGDCESGRSRRQNAGMTNWKQTSGIPVR